jgi:hypothetical protein
MFSPLSWRLLLKRELYQEFYFFIKTLKCSQLSFFSTVFIIPPQCCGSGKFNRETGPKKSRIRIRIKPTQTQTQKLFQCSRKYDPGCSSRIQIPDPDLDFLPFPDPGSRAQKGTGSRIRNTASPIAYCTRGWEQ